VNIRIIESDQVEQLSDAELSDLSSGPEVRWTSMEPDIDEESTDSVVEFALSIARGLSDTPKRLECRYLYDQAGSQIFERITEQPEYYLTRTEWGILQSCASDIAKKTGDVTLVELGSGSSVKTRTLLDAYSMEFGTTCYTPVDVSHSILEQARDDIAARFPSVKVDPIHGTYDEAFTLLKTLTPSMLLFLGSTIGNLDSSESLIFWDKISSHMVPGDHLLLGVDINDDPESLNAAYNDEAGHSEAFTRNLFTRMNSELGSNVDVSEIDHVAKFSVERSRVEIFARFNTEQTIDIVPLEQSFTIAKGEMILTEISRKFRLPDIVSYVKNFRMEAREVYTDTSRKFAVLLIERV